MKQLIILTSMIVLGCFLFGIIAGKQDGSIYSGIRSVWLNEIEARTVSEPY